MPKIGLYIGGRSSLRQEAEFSIFVAVILALRARVVRLVMMSGLFSISRGVAGVDRLLPQRPWQIARALTHNRSLPRFRHQERSFRETTLSLRSLALGSGHSMVSPTRRPMSAAPTGASIDTSLEE